MDPDPPGWRIWIHQDEGSGSTRMKVPDPPGWRIRIHQDEGSGSTRMKDPDLPGWRIRIRTPWIELITPQNYADCPTQEIGEGGGLENTQEVFIKWFKEILNTFLKTFMLKKWIIHQIWYTINLIKY